MKCLAIKGKTWLRFQWWRKDNIELCSILWCSPLIWEPACDGTHFGYLGLQVPQIEAERLVEEANVRLHLVVPLLEYLWICTIYPPSRLGTAPLPPRCAGSRGRCTGWSGWTLPRAMTWFVTHPQNGSDGPTVSQATGNHLIWGCFCLAKHCQRELPSLSPHQRLLFDSSLVGLDSESGFWYLEGKCQKCSYPFHVEKQGYSHREGQALSVCVCGVSVLGMLFFLS